MLQKINPSETQEWQELKAHYDDMKSVHMKTLFKNDPDRFNDFSLQFNDILIDYSKNIVDKKEINRLRL